MLNSPVNERQGLMLASPPRPLAKRYINKTGAPSVKGSLVCPSSSVDFGVILEDSEYDTIGVMLENGVPDGSYCWVQCGGLCQMLLKDGEAAARKQVVLAADTDGRCIAIDVPSASPAEGQHFKEVGHCVAAASAGTDVLVWVESHFN